MFRQIQNMFRQIQIMFRHKFKWMSKWEIKVSQILINISSVLGVSDHKSQNN